MKEKLFSEVIAGSYDSKHYNNLSTKEVPEQIVRELEKGCSLETLNEIAKDFPMCKYQTQITIHGQFNCDVVSRIGMYKNVVKNQNGSLGVRWSAIDNDKKDKLAEILKPAGWHIERDSMGTMIVKTKLAETLDEAKKLYMQASENVKKYDTKLFTGETGARAFCEWGRYIVCEYINLCCFPIDNMYAIATNLSGMRKEELEQANKKLQEEENERKQAEAKEREEAKARELKIREDFEAWKLQNPKPFRDVENYTPQEGDIIAKYNRDGEKFYIVFWKVVKKTRTFYLELCTQEGELLPRTWDSEIKLGAKPKTYKSADVKEANEQKQETKPQKTAQTRKPAQPSDTQPKNESKPAEMKIIDYSDRAIAVVGNTMQFVAQLKGLGGRYNARLTCGKGWIFPATKRESVAKALNL